MGVSKVLQIKNWRRLSMKKWLTFALAGALALPLAATHEAHAETPVKPTNHVYYKYVVQPMNFDKSDFQHLDFNQLLKDFPNLQQFMNQFHSQQAPEQQTPKAEQPKAQEPVNQPTQQKQSTTQQKQPVPTQVKQATPSSYSLSQFEKQVVNLTNKERTKRGLSPLKIDTTLSKMARDKSADMRDHNYFSHQSPTYGSPFDMMKKYGISYTTAGENIAAGQKSPEDVVNAWMNSEGHRANILNPNYTYIGVGYVKGGSYGSYWTQDFIGK
jgi:uncharacterized YkwD family protein